jgi:polyhydroxyalkanoate synthesis regulator phasin
VDEELHVTDRERIAQLERQIEELKARLPKHSVPPAMIVELEELEEQLEALQAHPSRHDK